MTSSVLKDYQQTQRIPNIPLLSVLICPNRKIGIFSYLQKHVNNTEE
jgi:hypothetical protein